MNPEPAPAVSSARPLAVDEGSLGDDLDGGLVGFVDRADLGSGRRR